MAQQTTIRRTGAGVQSSAIDQGLRAHMNKVYALMSIAMVVTAAVAFGMSQMATTTNPDQAVGQLQNGTMLTSLGAAIYTSWLRWIIMFAPLAMVFAFGAAINRLSYSAAQLMFYGFAALMGLSISWIFVIYTGMSITQTFLITAIAFAGLSMYGYTTKRDISGWGSFLIMGVIGLIVASLVNIWLQSDAIQFAVSILGVLIFAGLTAYDTQNIKNTYLQMAAHGQTEWLQKSAIMGALNLYLDFINLFMFLLQFLGNRE